MNIEQAEINTIKPYKDNPRRNERAVEHVVSSIEKYGFQQPIVVDANREIIVGHTRYKAAQKLKYTHVPVVVASDLTEEQVRAYRIADNKTNEYALWDESVLAKEFEDLLKDFDLSTTASMTAFSEREIDKLLNGKNYLDNQVEAEKQQQAGFKQHRIALVVPKNAYVNRGIGTYINGWIEWALRNNQQVDIISNNDDVRNSQFDRYESAVAWLSVDDGKNTDDKITMREPIFRIQDTADIRNSIYSALQSRQYDAFILNTPDSLVAAMSLNIQDYTDRIYYVSHAVTDIELDKDFTSSLVYSLIKLTGIRVIAQSTWMKELLVKSGLSEDKVYVQLPPLGQPELLEFTPRTNRKGVLFIGPYEDRKNPEVFIKLCKETNLPALLITPSVKSADKFKQRFLEEGILHEIHVALTGQTKVDVIKSAALAVIPSKEETFCYTAIEAATACPTLIPEDYAWTQVHQDWCHVVPENTFVEQAQLLYGKDITDKQQQALLNYQQQSDSQGFDLLKTNVDTKTTNNALTKYLDKVGTATQREFVLSRPSAVVDEMYYTFKLFTDPDYEITHDRDDTYIKYLKYIEPAHATTQADSDRLLATLLNIEE